MIGHERIDKGKVPSGGSKRSRKIHWDLVEGTIPRLLQNMLVVELGVALLVSPLHARSNRRASLTLAALESSGNPGVETLERWTREYYQAARQGQIQDGRSMDEMLQDYQWFDETYVLTGPDVGPLCKSDYIATRRGFTLDYSKASPDLDYLLSGFHLDPDNPYRVWFTLRYTGTHTGEARIGKIVLKPSGASIRGGPELHSIWWTPDKQIKWETVGYVGCKYTGTNRGYGGLAGLLIPLGLPRPFFDAISSFGIAKSAFWLSQFNEASETGGRARSPDSALPAWWRDRQSLGMNLF